MQCRFPLNCLAVPLGILLWVAPTGAQDRLDRNPLDFHSERVALQQPREVKGLILPKLRPSDTLGVWTLQPRISFSDLSSASGVALTYANKKLFSSLPFNGSVTEKAVSGSSHTRNQLQLYAELDPDLSALNAALSLALSGVYVHTATVSSVFEGSGELDCDVPNAPGFNLGVIGYLDEEDPVSGPIRNGATAGLTAGWKVQAGKLKGRAEVAAEYDFKSDFAGEDGFLAKAMYTLYRAPKIVLVGGFQKHNEFLVALKTTFAQLRRPEGKVHRK